MTKFDLRVEFLNQVIDDHIYVVALAEIRGEPAVLVVDPALSQPSPGDVANVMYSRVGSKGKVYVGGEMRRVYPAVIVEFVPEAEVAA